ncbi:MAG: hypothetical protein AAF656_00905 [Planctomycetota bacterium]
MTVAEQTPTNPSGGTDVMLGIAHYALLSGLCQFIPVPFADDLADARVRRQMVEKLLRQRGRSFDPDAVKPLWAGRSQGILAAAGGFAKGLVLKPVKKLLSTVFFVFTIRRAILEATEALALGHTIDRLLAAGWFADDTDATALATSADRVSRAVEAASSGADWRGLKLLVRQTARQFKSVRWPFRRSEQLTPEQQQTLDAASADLRARLETPEAQSALARFDAEVDRHLAGG